MIQQGDQTIEARKEILIKKMDETQKTMDWFGSIIELYESAVLKIEKLIEMEV